MNYGVDKVGLHAIVLPYSATYVLISLLALLFKYLFNYFHCYRGKAATNATMITSIMLPLKTLLALKPG